MRFILKMNFILFLGLVLFNSVSFASVDKKFLMEIMKDTWKIQNESLLKNWSKFERKEYHNSLSTRDIDNIITFRSRLEWNKKDQILTIYYFNRYMKDHNYTGSIRIYLNTKAPSYNYQKKLNNDASIESVVMNGVRFYFNEFSNVVEVFLGDLTKDDRKDIEDRLRVAVNANEIFNPWLRIRNPDLKKEFKDNPEDGYYLSRPQEEAIEFLKKIYEEKKLKKGALIQLPTGMGKTKTIFSFIKYLEREKNPDTDFLSNNRNYRVLWFVSGVDVLTQTSSDFNVHFSNDSMFSLYGDTNTEDNRELLNDYNDLAVSLDTLAKKSINNGNDEDSRENIERIEKWIRSSKKPVIIVVDEAHRSAAGTYLQAVETIRKDCANKINGFIGMTATPYRSDLDLPEIYGSWYMWEVNNDNQRKIKTAYDQILSASRQGYIPLVAFRSLNKKSLEHENKKNSYDIDKLQEQFLETEFLNRVSKSNNKILIYHARGKGEDGRSTNRQYDFMQFIQKHQRELRNIGFEAVYSVTAEDRIDQDGILIFDKFRTHNKAILNLTGIGDYGIDIPDIDCIIFLDESQSRVKITQRIGREFRLSGGKPIVSIYDWGTGSILRTLNKPIFYNEDPKEVKKRVEDDEKILEISDSILHCINQIEQLPNKNNEFITGVNITDEILKMVSTSLADLRELAILLSQQDIIDEDKMTLNNVIQKIIDPNRSNKSNTQMFFYNMKDLQDYLKKVHHMTILELSEILKYCDSDTNIVISKKLIESIIIEMMQAWILKNERYPQQTDFGSDSSDKVGFSYYKIEKIFGNKENRSGVEVLKEQILKDKKTVFKIKSIILSKASWPYDYWWTNKERKEILRKICIDMIYSHINTAKYNLKKGEKILLSAKEIEKILNCSYGRILYTRTESKKFDRESKGLFSGVSEVFDQLISYYPSAEKYTKAIILEELPTKQEVIEKIFEWIDELPQNEKHWPLRNEVTTEVLKLPATSEILIKRANHRSRYIFESWSDLLREAMELDTEEKYLKYIVKAYFKEVDKLYNYNSKRFGNTREKLQNCVIEEYIIPWIIVYKKWPAGYDFKNDSEGKINIGSDKILSLFGNMSGIMDALFKIDNLQELIDKVYKTLENSDNEEKINEEDIYQYIIDNIGAGNNSNILKVKHVREKLQRFFLKKYVIPYIQKNGKFSEIQQETQKVQKYVEYSVMLVFDAKDKKGNVIKKGLFDSKKELEELVEEIYDGSILDKKDLISLRKNLVDRSIDSRVELIEVLNSYIVNNQITGEDSFIEQAIVDIVVSWMKEYGRHPESKDYGIEEDQVGVYYSMINRFFSDPNDKIDRSLERLKEKIIDSIDKDIERKKLDLETGRKLRLMILNSNLFADYWCADENRRKKLQKLCRDQMIYWIRKNNRYPQTFDYSNKDSEASVGIISRKIEMILGNEDNPTGKEVLKEQILDLDERLEFAKVILQSSLDTNYWHSNEGRREKLQKICLNLIFNDIEKNKNIVGKIDLSYEKLEEILGISRRKIYSGFTSSMGIFESRKELFKQLIAHDVDGKYIEYITYDVRTPRTFYKSVESKLPSKEEVINIVFDWIDNLKEDEKHWPTLQEVGTIMADRVGEDFSRYIIRNNNTSIFVFENYQEFTKKAIRLDVDGKYLKYIIKGKLITDIYEDQDIRTRLQDCFIIDYLIPWIIENRVWPSGSDFGTDDNAKIPFNKNKIFGNSRVNGMFENMQELMNRTVTINRKDKRISEKNMFKYISSSGICPDFFSKDNI